MEKAFRVWNVKKQEMYYLDDGNEDTSYFMMLDNSGWGLFERGKSDAVANSGDGDILMQYSGLLCIDKVPIFEGDLIVFHRRYTGKPELWGKVVLDNGAFYIPDYNNNKGKNIYLKDIHEVTLSDTIEVIGNIYTKPYLLKEEVRAK